MTTQDHINSLRDKRETIDKQTIRHALDVARSTFLEHVKTFKNEKPSAFMTADALNAMAQQFQAYADNVRELYDKLDDVDAIEFVTWAD